MPGGGALGRKALPKTGGMRKQAVNLAAVRRMWSFLYGWLIFSVVMVVTSNNVAQVSYIYFIYFNLKKRKREEKNLKEKENSPVMVG